MLTHEDIMDTLRDIKISIFGQELLVCLDIKTLLDGTPVYLLQIKSEVFDHAEGKKVLHGGGKYYISQYSTKGEIVQKVFMACRQFINHELREVFTYKERAIFNPHLSLDELYDRAWNIEVRD